MSKLEIEILFAVITVVANFFLGCFVIIRNRKSWTNRLLFLLATMISVYVFVNFLSLHPPTPDSQLFWIRIVMATTSIIGPIPLLLVLTFPKKNITLKKRYLIPLLTLMVASVTVSILPYVFTDLQFINNKPVPTPGPGIPIFLLDFVGMFFLSFIVLIYRYIKARGLLRLQLLYMLVGILFTFSLFAFFTVLPVVFLKNSDFVFLAPTTSIFMIGFMAYAIIRHRLLDIKLILIRAVTYVLALLILASAYAGIFLFFSQILFPGIFNSKELTLLITTVILTFMALTFPFLKKGIEIVTDKFLYKKTYNAQELYDSMSHIIISTFDLNLLGEMTISKLHKEFNTLYIGVLLKDKGQEIYSKVVGVRDLNLSDPFIKNLEKFSDDTLSYEDLRDGSKKDFMREKNLSLIVKLKVNNKIIGYLFLGQKASGEIYYSKDLDVLGIITNQMAIAFKNAEAIEEIRDFNITLREEIKRATAKLRKANIKLKELDKLKDEFVSLASHELLTPMTGLKNSLWMVKNKIKKTPKQCDSYLKVAYQFSERLIKLVKELLDISRIESGKIELDIEKINLSEIVEKVVNIFNENAKKQKIKLILDIPQKSFVYADSDKVYEIVSNLISNALKYIKFGSITITIKKEKNKYKCSIIDTGIGIPKKDHDKIFQKFGISSNNHTKSANIRATGIGLWITKRLVEMMNGKIAFESVINKGSTFYFTLPTNK